MCVEKRRMFKQVRKDKVCLMKYKGKTIKGEGRWEKERAKIGKDGSEEEKELKKKHLGEERKRKER